MGWAWAAAGPLAGRRAGGQVDRWRRPSGGAARLACCLTDPPPLLRLRRLFRLRSLRRRRRRRPAPRRARSRRRGCVLVLHLLRLLHLRWARRGGVGWPRGMAAARTQRCCVGCPAACSAAAVPWLRAKPPIFQFSCRSHHATAAALTMPPPGRWSAWRRASRGTASTLCGWSRSCACWTTTRWRVRGRARAQRVQGLEGFGGPWGGCRGLRGRAWGGSLCAPVGAAREGGDGRQRKPCALGPSTPPHLRPSRLAPRCTAAPPHVVCQSPPAPFLPPFPGAPLSQRRTWRA